MKNEQTNPALVGGTMFRRAMSALNNAAIQSGEDACTSEEMATAALLVELYKILVEIDRANPRFFPLIWGERVN